MIPAESVTGESAPRVVLTGFMGSGKSTLGRALAARLGVDFIDTDREIEARTGRTIPEIFAAEGESAFREIEADVVRSVLETADGVVALGGGSPTVPAIIEALSGHQVAYLEIDAVAGFRRVADSDRPLLASPDPRQRYAELLAARASAYEDVATLTVDATRSVSVVVEAIVSQLTPETSDPDSAQEDS